MGVLVMEMVEASGAGVLYTDDPRGGGHHHQRRLRAGLPGRGRSGGAGHLQGRRRPVGGQHVGEKTRMHVACPGGRPPGPGGPGRAPGPCLVESQVLALAALGQQGQASIFACPRISSGPWRPRATFILFQARPLRVSRQLNARLSAAPDQGGRAAPGKRHHRLPGSGRGPVHLLQDEDLEISPRGGAGDHPGLAGIRRGGGPGGGGGLRGRQRHQPPGHGAAGGQDARRCSAPEGPPAGCVRRRAGHRGRLLWQCLRRPVGGIAQGAPGRRRGCAPDPGLQGAGAVLRHITPLNLLDPRGENFRPEGCRTYHDITRLPTKRPWRSSSRCPPGSWRAGRRRLVSAISPGTVPHRPGRRPEPEPPTCRRCRPEHLRSRPMLAYWRGVSAVGWQGPKPVDLAGFISVVMSAATDTNVRERLHEKNFAIITDDYLNLSNRLGFHFATIESFLGIRGRELYQLHLLRGRGGNNPAHAAGTLPGPGPGTPGFPGGTQRGFHYRPGRRPWSPQPWRVSWRSWAA